MPAILDNQVAQFALGFDWENILGADRPLVSAELVRCALRLPTIEAVVARTQGGWRAGDAFEFAWDISSPGAERKEVRIYWACVKAQRDKAVQIPSEARIYREIIPPLRAGITTHHLAERWDCSQRHIESLIEARCLQALTEARRGPGGSREVTRASAVDFLKRNRIK